MKLISSCFAFATASTLAKAAILSQEEAKSFLNKRSKRDLFKNFKKDCLGNEIDDWCKNYEEFSEKGENYTGDELVFRDFSEDAKENHDSVNMLTKTIHEKYSECHQKKDSIGMTGQDCSGFMRAHLNNYDDLKACLAAADVNLLRNNRIWWYVLPMLLMSPESSRTDQLMMQIASSEVRDYSSEAQDFSDFFESQSNCVALFEASGYTVQGFFDEISQIHDNETNLKMAKKGRWISTVIGTGVSVGITLLNRFF